MRSPSDFRGRTSTGKSPGAVRVWLLGGFRVSVNSKIVEDDTWRLRKAASLVKVLALAPKHRLPREQAMELLWPDFGREAASNNLRQTLYASRKAFDVAGGSRYLASEDASLVLCARSELWVDVEAFEEAAAVARRSQDPAAYRAAIELYSGELLPEDRYEEWAETRREELRRLYLALLGELAGLYEERGEHRPAVEALRRVEAEEPTLEEAHTGLMRLYALSGRRAEAMVQYGRLREVLSSQLGAKPSAATRCLRDEIAAGRLPPNHLAAILPEESPAASKHNLPAPRTSFIGREREIVEVERALAMTRLLTLTGAGGSGKTRFALEVARDLVGAYTDGVWLVELAPLSEGELVAQVVAGTLGVKEQPGRMLIDTLVDAMRHKNLLMVLDNCEHVVESTAHLADALLDGCPRLRLFATSREALGVAGETVWLVPPLSLPDPQRSPTVGDLEGYGATRLFVARASDRRPGFSPGPASAGVIAEICRRLDGLPLAIELAAARTGALSVEQISARLGDSLSLLTRGGRTTEPRQQSLRAALDWSHELLGESERVLFRRLSAFVGGCTLEAAEMVGAGGEIKKSDVLDLLSRLVDKSLIAATEAVGETGVRYAMLEPIRQYALERLEECGDAEIVRRRHAAFYLTLAEAAEPELQRAHQRVWLGRLEAELGNLRGALSWALASGEIELALRLAGAMAAFWYRRGDVHEGRRWLEAVLNAEGDTPSIASRAKALAWAGWLARVQGDYERSEALGEEALALFRSLGDERGATEALYNVGMTALFRRNFERASAALEEVATTQRAAGDEVGLGRTFHALVSVADGQHDYERAMVLHEEGLRLARKTQDDYGVLFLLFAGASACLGRGDHQRARALLREGFGLSQQLKMSRLTAFQLHVAAALAGSQGQPLRAARLWGAAEALREALRVVLSPFQRHVYGPHLAAARTRLGEKVWEAALVEGQAMPLEEAIGYALSEKEFVRPTVTAAPEQHVPSLTSLSVLTSREKEVALLVARGFTNHQIATGLSISEHTAATHVARILKKLDFHSRAQVASTIIGQQPYRPIPG
jgi:predicted ATPase/DNA-binding SARP family transcriptional activator/DNA-binding CsgD family transcriptional regulator